jgi:hypothetical protein
MDIGYEWHVGGNAAWLRLNALLVSQLHSGDPALATIRAVNYSPDGRKKQRIDRENGWAVQSSADSVDVHTHIEWYRDTEGKRQASLDRIDALVAAAIANKPAANGDTDMSTTSDNIIKAWSVGNQQGAGGEDVEPVKWRVADLAWQKGVTAALAGDQARDQAMLAAIQALSAGGTSVDTSAVIAAIQQAGATESAAVQALQAQVADLQTKLANAGHALG